MILDNEMILKCHNSCHQNNELEMFFNDFRIIYHDCKYLSDSNTVQFLVCN